MGHFLLGLKMAFSSPSLVLALLVVVALAHKGDAGTNLDDDRRELGAISSKIEELKQKFKHDLRNRVDLSSLESSVVSLLDTVANLTTKMEAFATKDKKLETCLADVSSSDCPAPPSGKTGVAAIITNTNAIALKCDATKCTEVENKVVGVESCLGDKTSSDCPEPSSGKVSVMGAITALETPPVFSCRLGPTPGVQHVYSVDVLMPYAACDINVGNGMDKTSGKFTAPKPGKYRFTFMCLMVVANNKEVRASFVKTTGATETSLAEGRARMDGSPDAVTTTTLDHIVELAAADTIHVSISLTSPSIVLVQQNSAPHLNFFSGEFITA